MQHNRKLHISTAGTRKTKHWPETEILWSEFVDRVKTPVRSTETVEEYLAMPKYRQHKKTRWVCTQTPCDRTTGCDRVSG